MVKEMKYTLEEDEVRLVETLCNDVKICLGTLAYPEDLFNQLWDKTRRWLDEIDHKEA